MSELQFISTDSELLDAWVSPDVFKAKVDEDVKSAWETALENTEMPKEVSHFSYRKETGLCTNGVKMSDKDAMALVKYLIENLKAFRLNKASGYLQFTEITNIKANTDKGVANIGSVEELEELLSKSISRVFGQAINS